MSRTAVTMPDTIPIKDGAARVLYAEGLMTLRVAAMCVPPRNGFTVTAEVLRDWSERGACGVWLEVVMHDGELCTTWPALARFIKRVQERFDAGIPTRRGRKDRRG